jgi:hypothetical protein
MTMQLKCMQMHANACKCIGHVRAGWELHQANIENEGKKASKDSWSRSTVSHSRVHMPTYDVGVVANQGKVARLKPPRLQRPERPQPL